MIDDRPSESVPFNWINAPSLQLASKKHMEKKPGTLARAVILQVGRWMLLSMYDIITNTKSKHKSEQTQQDIVMQFNVTC
jgi:hypothetical protein